MTRPKQGDRLSIFRALSRLSLLSLCLLSVLFLAPPDCVAKPKAAPPSKKPSPQEILGRAQTLESKKQYEQAVAAYREYLVVNPADDEARTALADALSRHGKLDEAVAEYEAVLARYPDRLTLILALAGVKARQKKFQDAQTLYEKVLRADPNSLVARRGLAGSLYLSGQRRLALPHYETLYAATKDPTVAELIKNVKAEPLERARELDAAQRYKEAEAAYREYLAARPDDDDARTALARTLALQGLLPEAVALYQEVLSRHPSDISALVGIGKIFIWQKKPGSAQSYYAEALRINPANLEARRGMADVLYWSGKDKDALRAYEEIFSSTQDAEAGERVRELRGERLGTPRAPIGKTQLLPTLPFRDYIKAGYSHYAYTQGIADERDYLLEGSTSLGNHTLVGRLERLHRFSFEDIPFSAELYSPLWDKAWGSLSLLATASPNFAPNYLLGGEVFQSLGALHRSLASLELSASYKRLAYGYRARTSATLFIPSQEIDVLSPSLTYYLPYNLWLTEKLLYVPQTGSITLSSRLTWRPTDRLEAYASGAFGTSGERIIAFQDFTRVESRSYQGGVIFPITESFSGEISAFYEDRGFLYIRRGGSFNLIWHF